VVQEVVESLDDLGGEELGIELLASVAVTSSQGRGYPYHTDTKRNPPRFVPIG